MEKKGSVHGDHAYKTDEDTIAECNAERDTVLHP